MSMTPEERALEALFKHRDFPIADCARGESDCYAISIPTLVRMIEAAEVEAGKYAMEIAIDAVTMSGLVDNVSPGSGWQQRIRDYCRAILNKGEQT